MPNETDHDRMIRETAEQLARGEEKLERAWSLIESASRQ